MVDDFKTHDDGKSAEELETQERNRHLIEIAKSVASGYTTISYGELTNLISSLGQILDTETQMPPHHLIGRLEWLEGEFLKGSKTNITKDLSVRRKPTTEFIQVDSEPVKKSKGTKLDSTKIKGGGSLSELKRRVLNPVNSDSSPETTQLVEMDPASLAARERHVNLITSFRKSPVRKFTEDGMPKDIIHSFDDEQ